MKRLRSSLPAVLLTMLVLMTNILARSIFSPLLLHIESDFRVSHGPASRLFMYIGIGYSLSLLFSGFFASKISHRIMILISTILISFSVCAAALSGSLDLLGAAVFMMGIGAGFYPASGIATLTDLVDQRDWQKAFSINETGPHTAMLLAPLFANFMLRFTGWRGTMAALSVLVLTSGLLFFFTIKAGDFKGDPPTFSTILPLFRNTNFWILMLFFGLALGGIQGIYLLVPTFMVTEAGFPLEQANNIFGISRFLPILSLLSAGMLMDRVGKRRTIMITIFGAGLMILFTGLFKGPLLIIAIFLQPAVGALFFPAGISFLSAIAPSKSRNIAVSMVLPAAILLGTGVIPSFLGYMGDVRSFAFGFVLVGVLMMASSLMTFRLKAAG